MYNVAWLAASTSSEPFDGIAEPCRRHILEFIAGDEHPAAGCRLVEGTDPLTGGAMLTADDFRDLALRLNGATEGAHMGHPDFRAGGRIFASLHANEETGTVRLTPDEQRELISAYPRMFTPAAGAWGLQGWTVVRLQAAEEAAVRAAVLLAWQSVTSPPAPARRTKPSATRSPSPRKRKP